MKRFILMVAALVTSAAAFAQLGPSQVVTWTTNVEATEEADVYKVVFDGKVAEGYHTYTLTDEFCPTEILDAVASDCIEFNITEGTTEENSYVDAWTYAIPHLKLGAWNAILTVSSNAYGATGVSGSSSSSSSSSYYDYYNYYNYYNSYYGNSYYNNYYNSYYGGMGMGGYGGMYGSYYPNYYDSYYYDSYYNDSYYQTDDTNTITSEVLPYTPIIWQVYVEPRD